MYVCYSQAKPSLSLQVTLVHVNATAKNAADDKLRQSLRRFAHTYPAPSTVVLISGDVNFSPELNDLRHVHNITIILVHNLHASEALKVFAHKLICYEEFLQDVEAPKEPQVHVVVYSHIYYRACMKGTFLGVSPLWNCMPGIIIILSKDSIE